MYGMIYETKHFHPTRGMMLYRGQKKLQGRDDISVYKGSGVRIRNAVKKYGKKNFVTIPICFCQTHEELNEMERKYVSLEWCNRKDTYNLREGGNVGRSSEDLSKKLSRIRQGWSRKGGVKKLIEGKGSIAANNAEMLGTQPSFLNRRQSNG